MQIKSVEHLFLNISFYEENWKQQRRGLKANTTVFLYIVNCICLSNSFLFLEPENANRWSLESCIFAYQNFTSHGRQTVIKQFKYKVSLSTEHTIFIVKIVDWIVKQSLYQLLQNTILMNSIFNTAMAGEEFHYSHMLLHFITYQYKYFSYLSQFQMLLIFYFLKLLAYEFFFYFWKF